VEDESGLLPRVLQTVIAWGRHGEVFEYDYTTGMIGLPTVDEGEKTAAS
jgi:NitT/TauT family transport system ATP-binding protein